MTKPKVYSIGNQVLFRYQKGVRAGRLKALFPSLDRRGRITTHVTIETTYRDMGGNEHIENVPVLYSAIVGLQEQEKREVTR